MRSRSGRVSRDVVNIRVCTYRRDFERLASVRAELTMNGLKTVGVGMVKSSEVAIYGRSLQFNRKELPVILRRDDDGRYRYLCESDYVLNMVVF